MKLIVRFLMVISPATALCMQDIELVYAQQHLAPDYDSATAHLDFQPDQHSALFKELEQQYAEQLANARTIKYTTAKVITPARAKTKRITKKSTKFTHHKSKKIDYTKILDAQTEFPDIFTADRITNKQRDLIIAHLSTHHCRKQFKWNCFCGKTLSISHITNAIKHINDTCKVTKKQRI